MKKNVYESQHMTVEKMAEKFRKDGWSQNVSFTEMTLEDAKEIGCFSIEERIRKGFKYFKMVSSGNIYDHCGNVVMYNLRPSRISV